VGESRRTSSSDAAELLAVDQVGPRGSRSWPSSPSRQPAFGSTRVTTHQHHLPELVTRLRNSASQSAHRGVCPYQSKPLTHVTSCRLADPVIAAPIP
jgi:hypothetical protein